MKKAVNQKTPRTRYSREFKQQALARAERDGVSKAAQELGLYASQLYTWRTQEKHEGRLSADQKSIESEHERLKREVSRLEEENAFLKKASAYFAKQGK